MFMRKNMTNAIDIFGKCRHSITCIITELYNMNSIIYRLDNQYRLCISEDLRLRDIKFMKLIHFFHFIVLYVICFINVIILQGQTNWLK